MNIKDLQVNIKRAETIKNALEKMKMDCDLDISNISESGFTMTISFDKDDAANRKQVIGFHA